MDEVFHFVMPSDPNMTLSDADMEMIAGGKGGKRLNPTWQRITGREYSEC